MGAGRSKTRSGLEYKFGTHSLINGAKEHGLDVIASSSIREKEKKKNLGYTDTERSES
jgi:hypothetical protein